jgi:CDP-glucose 4,6-dehydratase
LPPRRDNDPFRLLNLAGALDHTEADIRDLGTLRQVLSRFAPEVVFHLAAQPLVRTSYTEPKETFDTNIGGSVNVLEAVRQTPSVRALVYVTSDKCYRNQEWIWGYRETDELGGPDPYSASKAAAELVFKAYQESFFRTRPGFGAASARAGNVIGGGDWSDHRIVPDCLKALLRNEPIQLRHPQATRPWQHVLEPLSGYLLLAARLLREPTLFSGSWNFGPSAASAHSVRELADQIVRCWGGGEVRVVNEPHAPAEAGLLHLNCDQAHLRLGWRPRWGFERTVEETVRWYRAVCRPGATGQAGALTTQQLAAYLQSPP